MEDDYFLIDSPVGPFSPVNEIEAWIVELKDMQKNQQVDDAIAEAEDWILNHGA